MISKLLISVTSLTLSSAFASLIPATPFEVPMTGTGFGNVSTLITLQTQDGQTTSEAGCIGFSNLTTNCGIAQVGKIKNSSTTEPVPSGITDASALRFIFNAAEPSGGSINLNQLQVSFYGNSSTSLYTASIAAPITLTSTLPGTGNSGFVFMLDTNQAAQATAVLSQTRAIGAGFSATNASGGQDTVFLGTAATTHTPEPATFILMGAGMLAVGIIGRKRKSA